MRWAHPFFFAWGAFAGAFQYASVGEAVELAVFGYAGVAGYELAWMLWHRTVDRSGG